MSSEANAVLKSSPTIRFWIMCWQERPKKRERRVGMAGSIVLVRRVDGEGVDITQRRGVSSLCGRVGCESRYE